jgi:hypothetical protein
MSNARSSPVKGSNQDVPVLGHGGHVQRQVPVGAAASARADRVADAIPARVRAGAVELGSPRVKREPEGSAVNEAVRSGLPRASQLAGDDVRCQRRSPCD